VDDDLMGQGFDGGHQDGGRESRSDFLRAEDAGTKAEAA
jgi:hypothetical protein